MIKDDSNKFNEELEKELQTGLHNTLDESQGQDFTVKVHREEYVVKRRFYDKDKALETAEDLRKDKRNVVEDNLEGQILSSADGDEDVDWDKLVDAGLQFDPPIAGAAALKPGDEPVGLTKLPDLPARDEEEAHADVNLEKTFLVRTKTPAPAAVDDTFNLEVEKEVDDMVVEEDEEDEAAEESAEEETGDEIEDTPSDEADATEEPEKKKTRSRYTPPVMPLPPKKPSKKKPALITVFILAVLAGVFFFMQNGKTPSGPAGDSPSAPVASTVKMPVPVSPGGVPAPVSAPRSEAVSPAADVKAPAVPAPAPPAAPPAPAASPAPAVVTAAGPLPFAVHSGSYRLPQEAASAVNGFRLKGLAAFSAFVTLADKGDWYRIYAGCYATLEEASAAASNIKQNFGEDALAVKAPWAIQVGKPVVEAKAAQVTSGLEAKGFTSYAVSEPGAPKGSVRIFVGAFTSVKDAGPMADSLKKEGFKTSVVRR